MQRCISVVGCQINRLTKPNKRWELHNALSNFGWREEEKKKSERDEEGWGEEE